MSSEPAPPSGAVLEGHPPGRGRTGSPRPQPPPSPPRGRWWIVAVVVAAVLLVVGAVTWRALTDHGSGAVSSTGPTTADPGPMLADLQGLQGIQAFLQHSVYWAGAQGRTSWEVQLVGRDLYVRYLPDSQPVGSKAPFLTVATYEKKDAYAGLLAASKQAGARSTTLARGALVVQPAGKPTSAYFAFTGSGLLMEVFDPTPGAAYQLIGSGAVQPVPSA